MNNETKLESPAPIVETASVAIENLAAVGRLWASHGLSIGRSALRASARTLEMTAETLAELEARFDERDQADERD